MQHINGLPGLYGVIEGMVGVGKGTQIERIKEPLSRLFPDRKIVYTAEPGGTPYSERIRTIVKTQKLSPVLEMELFASARGYQLGTIPQVVIPTLLEGGVVISDRSVISSLAYQGVGRRLGIENVWQYNKPFVLPFGVPDFVVLININPEVALQRKRGGSNNDKYSFEEVDFWNKIVNGYYESVRTLRNEYPQIKFLEIKDVEGNKSIEEIHGEFFAIISSEINRWVGQETIPKKECPSMAFHGVERG